MLWQKLVSQSRLIVCSVGLAFLSLSSAAVTGAEVLVADRITNRVLRYSDQGAFLGVLLEDSVNLSEPNGLALSPDGLKLLVASRQNSRIVQYDYFGTTAGNPKTLVSSGLNVPASVMYNGGGDKFYVSNLGAAFDGATVSQFNQDGSSAGPALSGGLPVGRSGLELSPNQDLLVSSFQDGSILRYDSQAGEFKTLVPANQALMGLGNLVVHGNDLYAAAGFTGMVWKFNAMTGEPDPTFTPISGLAFPASLSLGPDNNSLLVGVLGLANGTGSILKYGLDGTLLGTFAGNSATDPTQGYVEATGLLIAPGFVAPFCGDIDADRDVDSADLLGFIANWTGDTPGPGAPVRTFGEGDCDADGDVDSADLLGLLSAWTGAAGAESLANGAGVQTAIVPEPQSLGMLLVGFAWLVRRRSARG